MYKYFLATSLNRRGLFIQTEEYIAPILTTRIKKRNLLSSGEYKIQIFWRKRRRGVGI